MSSRLPAVESMTMKIIRNRVLAGFVTAAGLCGTAGAALAQQPQPWSTEQVKQAQSQPKAKAQTPPAAPKASAKEETGGSRTTEGALRQRVEQLEEQLADMQVMIGTLESLGKGGGGMSSGASAARVGGGAGTSAADQARIDSLETQLRALSTQVEQLTNQLRQNARRGDAGPLGEQPPAPRPDFADARSSGGFGSMTVTPGTPVAERDPIGKLINPEAPQPASSAPLPPTVAAAGNPKELYETAYGYLLQQDYGSAEVAFEEFLRRYPSDRQTADAQYWYAETLYVQRRYKPAAQAFLKVIERHQASSKVPNSLLKVAMALEQLGQKDCALFNELETRHPNAPADVKNKARGVKQRMGC